MGRVTSDLNDLQRRLSDISRISAEVLGAIRNYRWARDHDAVQYRFQLCDVMSVGSGDDEGQWDATLVDKQMAFGPIFFPDPWGSAQRIVGQGAPLS